MIDVDAHFMEPVTWLADANLPLARILDECLPPASFAEVVFGEVLADLPPEQQKTFLQIIPRKMGRFTSKPSEQALADLDGTAENAGLQKIIRPRGAYDPEERIALNSEHGIDLQFMNPTIALGGLQRVRRYAPQHLMEYCTTYNTWATSTLKGHNERLLAVPIIPFDNPEWAASELVRMRGLGCRGFLVPLFPVQGMALSHPHFEPIWTHAEDLGMAAIMHVAAGSVYFNPAWGNSGRDDSAKSAFFLALSQNPTIPQIPLADLIYGGVLERHPRLLVICSEFGLSWLEGWLDRLDPANNVGRMLGWHLPMRPLDYVRRNVKFSPLRGQNVGRAIDVVGIDSVAFASDYPHPEGSLEAVAIFEEHLKDRSKLEQDAFFGGNMGRWLAAA